MDGVFPFITKRLLKPLNRILLCFDSQKCFSVGTVRNPFDFINATENKRESIVISRT